MQSSFIPPQHLEHKESPEQLFQQSLEQKTKLQQEIARIQDASWSINTMPQVQKEYIYSQYQRSQLAMQAVDQSIHQLVQHYPHLTSLMPVAGLPTGPITGDHVPQGVPSTSSISTSSSFENPNAFFPGVLTFEPGIKIQSNPQKRGRPIKSRR